LVWLAVLTAALTTGHMSMTTSLIVIRQSAEWPSEYEIGGGCRGLLAVLVLCAGAYGFWTKARFGWVPRRSRPVPGWAWVAWVVGGCAGLVGVA
jgi:hypothetical protein